MNEAEYLRNILACAWQYDDKPHLLYRAVRYAAEAIEPPAVAHEIRVLMDSAVEQIAAQKICGIGLSARTNPRRKKGSR